MPSPLAIQRDPDGPARGVLFASMPGWEKIVVLTFSVRLARQYLTKRNRRKDTGLLGKRF